MKVQISEVKVNHSVETFPLWFHGLGTGMRSHEPLMQHICAVYQAAAVALENYKLTVGTDAVVDLLKDCEAAIQDATDLPATEK